MLVSPPSLFPGDGLSSKLPPKRFRYCLVSFDEAQQSLGHLPVARAPHQQMLGAEDLGGLGQHRRRADRGQHVATDAERRDSR